MQPKGIEMITAKHYYELHITVEAGDDFEKFRHACIRQTAHIWRASRFEIDDVDNMDGKWFASYRTKEIHVAMAALRDMRETLQWTGHKILRMKIEDTLFDTNYGDEL